MNILLVGDLERFEELLRDLRDDLRNREGEIQGFTHLADGARALAELAQGARRYRWVILEDRAVQGGGREIAAAVREMGPSSEHRQAEDGQSCSTHTCGDGRPADSRSGAPPDRHCGIEWDRNGVLQLRCCLKHLALPVAAPSAARRDFSRGLIFEYHGPCHTRSHNENGAKE